MLLLHFNLPGTHAMGIHFSRLLVLGFHKEDYLQIFNCVSFRLHDFCGKLEGWDPVNRFNHTSWVAIVTPTDRPKSVRNRCVIEVFGGVFVLSCCFLGFSVGEGDFVIGLSQICSFFSWKVHTKGTQYPFKHFVHGKTSNTLIELMKEANVIFALKVIMLSSLRFHL